MYFSQSQANWVIEPIQIPPNQGPNPPNPQTV